MRLNSSTDHLFPTPAKTYVVFGLGRTGLSVTRWLRRHDAQVLVVDDNPVMIAQALTYGAVAVEDPFALEWGSITAMVQSPGIPYHPQPHPLTKHVQAQCIPIIGDLDLFFAHHPHANIIGITGTNGKSTTTALITHLLTCAGKSVAMGGNIGVPVLDLPNADIYVIEASSYQLDLSPALPWSISVLLNITDDHLERHQTLAHYIAAKRHIFPEPFDTSRHIIGVDTPVSGKIWAQIGGVPISGHSSLSSGVYVNEAHLIDHLTQNAMTILDLRILQRLRGAHNHQNIAAAYAVGQRLGIPTNTIVSGIQSFSGLPHRQEWVGCHQGITVINDSKATNADAAATALEAFDDIFWILGGMDKTDGIDALLPYAPKVQHAFLIGKASERFANTLTDHVPFTCCQTLENAVQVGWEQAAVFSAQTGKQATLLLSPACASFDQFADFEQRGDLFKTYVQGVVRANS